MWFGLLGPLEAHDGERPIDLGPPQQRAVLAVLLVEANRVVPLERLVELLWGNDPPARATGALQVYISGLRHALEPDCPARMRSRYLVTQPPGYLLRVGPDEADAFRFQALAGTGRSQLADGRAAEGRATLEEALGLWRGPAHAEFALRPFAQREAARLEDLRAVALEDRIEADLALANHAEVVAELEFLVGEHPLRERLWGLLMFALYRSERQGEALRAFSRARTTLGEELGIEPGPVLRQLEEDILRQAPALAWRAPEPSPASGYGVRATQAGDGVRATQAGDGVRATQAGDSAGAEPSTASSAPAPVRPSVSRRSLVGRQPELEMLRRLLVAFGRGEGGLMLVSGEPGIGKTRLVEEVVAQAVERSALVAWGRCEDGDGSPSFWPWVQVIRSLLNGGDPDSLRRALAQSAGEIAQISPEVKELVPDFEPPAAVDPEAARLELFGAVNTLLAGMAGSRPLVVVLDDLHWADVPSLRMADFVAHRTAETGLLLVMAYRDVDPGIGGPLGATLDELARHPALHRAALSGLSEAECGVFIAETFGVEPSEALAATVHARTDGNPFFVGELARLLASEGTLSGDMPPGMRVPAGVRDVIRRRLSRLPMSTAELLVLAAS